MCRMVGMVSSEEAGQKAASGAAVVAPLGSISGESQNVVAVSRLPLPSWQHLVGAPNSLRQQAQTGCVPENCASGHDDSWGVGWFDDAGQVSLLRQVGSAADSPSYVFAAEKAARGGAGSGVARSLIGHLRKASQGGITSENSHPVRVDFRPTGQSRGADDTLLVAHNGTLRAPLMEALRGEAADAGREEARSDSDTVLLAGWLAGRVSAAEAGQDVFETVAESLQVLFERAEQVEGGSANAYTAVNLLIAHPDGLMALRQFSREGEYYTLAVRPLWRTEDGTDGWIVASEPTDDHPAWENLTPGVLTIFPARAGQGVREATVAGTVWADERNN